MTDYILEWKKQVEEERKVRGQRMSLSKKASKRTQEYMRGIWNPLVYRRPSKEQLQACHILYKVYPDLTMNYPVYLPKLGRNVFLDIAIPIGKIDVEIDCDIWHKRTKWNARPDQIIDDVRDEHLKGLGWTIIRVKTTNLDHLKMMVKVGIVS